METYTSLVRANGIIMLYTVSHIGLHPSTVVHPSHAKREDTVWNAQTLNQIRFLKLRVLIIDIFDGFQDLLNGLVVLRLAREAAFQGV